ncbi:glycosyltransferase family 31 protein, partial [Aplosporella prunicola CBS 121167]
QQPQQSQPPREPVCPQIPGAEDVLVIMKTGASEVQQKLPVHLETTFRCVPHFAVFSDLEEEVAGVHVHDTLDQVSEQIKQTNPDFQFYHQLREYRAAGRNVSELVQGSSQAAWNLDRWKFLPLMEKALKTRPEAKWFVFIEADTAIVWSNLLEWLQRFDPSKPYYIGGQSWVGEHQFGHGGTGFVVSNPALSMLVEKRAQNLDSFDQLTANTWVGDLVLGEAFETVGIYLTPAWPTLQGETPYSLDYTEHHWCYPVVSWHHMPPEWIKAVWEFEQEWLSSNKLPAIRHRDIFAQFVWPYIQQERTMWDNLSDDFEETPLEYTSDGCRAACEYRLECVQWLYTEGRCQTGAVIKLGGEVEEGGLDGTSGWVMERIQLFMQNVE